MEVRLVDGLVVLLLYATQVHTKLVLNSVNGYNLRCSYSLHCYFAVSFFFFFFFFFFEVS